MTVVTTPVRGRLGDGRSVELTASGGRIDDVREVPAAEGELLLLLPGLVDLQVNGYAGFDVNGAGVTPDQVVGMRRALADAGTGWFVPTVITASETDIVGSLAAIADGCDADAETAASVPWIHLEGPHLSELDGPRGAHDLAQVRPPDADEFDRWQAAARGRIGMVTLSPHHRGAAEYVRALVARGVRVSIGHTHATPEQIREAVDAGARFSTHLGNGIQAMVPRHPNAIWTQLADDRLTAGFIADGHHLPLDTLKAMIRAKGIERSFVVSDSVAIAGSSPGRYRAPVGGEVELDATGRLCVAGTPYLAGAALPLAAGIPTLLRAGFTEAEAVRLVLWNPAALAGMTPRLEVGAPAIVHLVPPPSHGRPHAVGGAPHTGNATHGGHDGSIDE